MSGLEVSHYTLLIPEAILNAQNSMHAGGIVSLRAPGNFEIHLYIFSDGGLYAFSVFTPSIINAVSSSTLRAGS